MDNTRSMEGFGIKINTLDIKGLDLPEENKGSVYQRMIAERKAITAKYTASGDKTLSVTQAQVEAESRQIISEANKNVSEIKADGAKQYYKILRDAYHASPDKEDFLVRCRGHFFNMIHSSNKVLLQVEFFLLLFYL